AEVRRLRFGPNALDQSAPEPGWRRVVRQLRDPLTVLLLVAAALSFLAWLVERESGWPYEALTVLAVVLLNSVLAVVQEGRAERALQALATLTPASALVLRAGIPSPVPAALLVPGDVLVLEEGQAIPADARVTEVAGLRIIESALTGESSPVSKQSGPTEEGAALGDRVSMVFAGSAVAGGRGRAVVTATGMLTELGRIAGLLRQTPQERTPLQRELDRVGRFLGRAVVLLAAVVTLSLLLAGQGRGTHAFLDVLLVGISLAVAAVPEGLTAICTIVLSLGTERMARRRAVVRRLTAVEALGAATVICSDKTGTLTRNEMTVRCLVTASGRADFTGVGYDPTGEVLAGGRAIADPVHAEEVRRALQAGVLANNAVLVRQGGGWEVRGDPTEGALLVAARKAGLDEAALAVRFPRRGEVPFSSERKLMSTAHLVGTERHVVSKGAPGILLARCARERVAGEERPLGPARRERILAEIEALAAEALRPLGLAQGTLSDRPEDAEAAFGPHVEQDLVWLGAVGMIDPPRAEAKAAVRVAREAGIRTVMITGDHPRTAAAVAAELGVSAPDEEVLRGADIPPRGDESLRTAVARTNVYARVSPEDKLRIVEALQQEGHVVAMTGDGVNDAPALKKADIGVAMGISGTDVSKSAADMVLLDDNYATIVAAVEEGRAIYENIQKFLRYLLSSNAGEVMTMFLGVVGAGALGLYLEDGRLVVPLVPTMILWMNLLTDALPALALGLDPPAPDVMRRLPRDPRTPAITPRMWLDIAGIGTVMALFTLAVMDLALPGGLLTWSGLAPGPPERAQTLAFTTLVLFQLWNVFATRSEEKSAFASLFTNPWLWLAVLVSLALQVLAVEWGPLQRAFGTVPLSLDEWLLCGA
ncbi:MAG TPA: cation-translocating P-type ATPase, partial [Vicinamibacteria bacterium]